MLSTKGEVLLRGQKHPPVYMGSTEFAPIQMDCTPMGRLYTNPNGLYTIKLVGPE